jgi:hypothetical protein
MIKSNKKGAKAYSTTRMGFVKATEPVTPSDRNSGKRSIKSNGNTLSDGLQTEKETVNSTFLNMKSGNRLKSDEFHWMAVAAYNQST